VLRGDTLTAGMPGALAEQHKAGIEKNRKHSSGPLADPDVEAARTHHGHDGCSNFPLLHLVTSRKVESMPGRSPAVRRRRLGIELRELREAAELTIEQVAERLEVSDSKISRIENGQVGATPRDVRDMATLYGVTGQRLENLMQLARETREKPWWYEYRDLRAIDFAMYEAEASQLLYFAPLTLPGLLQTPDYARAIIGAIRYDLPPEKIERRLEFRMKRQELLTGEEPPTLWAIIDEAILYRMIGGQKVMCEQLTQLVELARLPHVTLQVLPFGAGEHAGLDGPFVIIRFPEPTDRDMVYFEHIGLEHHMDDPAAVALHASVFDHLRAAALKPDDSLKLVHARAEELATQ
jgi:transcriptional regulator with XRE-family HTH domain